MTDRFKVLRCKRMRHGHMSAQCAELMALIEACEIGKGLEINVNTDMWYNGLKRSNGHPIKYLTEIK